MTSSEVKSVEGTVLHGLSPSPRVGTALLTARTAPATRERILATQLYCVAQAECSSTAHLVGPAAQLPNQRSAGGTILLLATLLPALALAQPMPERVTVTGRVTTQEKGRPIAGAAVVLRLLDSKGKATGNTLPVPGMSGTPTASDGRVTIYGVPEGKYYLSVSASGYQSFGQQVTVSPTAPASFDAKLAVPKYLFVKILTPDGKPVAKKSVYPSLLVGRSWRRTRSTSDAKGCCRLPLYKPRKVFAHIPGVGSSAVDADPKAPPGTPVEVRLEPHATVSGTVKEKGTGRPVAGVQIRLASIRLHKGIPNLSPYPQTAVNTNAKGSFLLRHVPAGNCTLSVVSSRVLKCNSAVAALQPGQKVKDIAFEAVLAPQIKGRLLGVNGAPLATLRSLPLRQWVCAANGKTKSFATQISVDADGRFCADARMFGKAQIGVSIPNEGWAMSPWTDFAEGKGVTLDLRLKPLLTLTGAVRDTNSSKPIPGATVKLTPVQAAEQFLGVPAEVHTDHRGRFVATNLPPSAYKVAASAFGYRASRPIDTTVGDSPVTANIKLQRAGDAK